VSLGARKCDVNRSGLPTSRRSLLACILASLCLQAFIMPSTATEIPVEVIILNAPPAVSGLALLDGWGPLFSGVDPGAETWLEAVIVDNNTISDMLLVRVTLFLGGRDGPESPEDHYTFTWTPGDGFSGDFLVPSACRAPVDMDGVGGTWRFAFQLSRTARSSPAWTCEVLARDEERSGTRRESFSVNEFTSVSLGTTSVSFSGAPGSTVPAVENPFQIQYLSNHPFELGVRATTFVGDRSPEFVIEPGAFSVSTSPETSGSSLSPTREVLLESGPGEGEIGLYIFVSVPDPFLDQDYSGKIIFDLRPGGGG